MKETFSEKRRAFLKGSGALIGGLAMIMGIGRRASATPQATMPTETAPKGYQETEHVKKYYETARL